MKKKNSKLLSIIFITLLLLISGQSKTVEAEVEIFSGHYDDVLTGRNNLNDTPNNSAKVGDVLLLPEVGWSRYDNSNSKIEYVSRNWKHENSLNPTMYKGNRSFIRSKEIAKIKFSSYCKKIRILGLGGNRNEVYIDGQNVGYLLKNTGNSLLFEYEMSTLGNHTIEIVIDSYDKYKPDSFISLDAIDVAGELIDSNGKVPEPVLPVDFNEAMYLLNNNDVAEAVKKGQFKNGAAHWLAYGWAEKHRVYSRPVMPVDFNEDMYLLNNKDVAEAVKKGLYQNGAEHWLTWGWAQKNRVYSRPAVMPVDFNEDIYLLNNKDVAEAVKKGLYKNGAEHWLAWGWAQKNRVYSRPSVMPVEFNEDMYLLNNEDVAEAVKKGQFKNGAAHWLAYGWAEKHRVYSRPVMPVDFNEDMYLLNNKDVADAVKKGLYKSGAAHWLAWGWAEKHRVYSRPLMPVDFNEYIYLLNNEDVAEAVKKGQFKNGAAHWLAYGWAEKRIYSKPVDWDDANYRKLHPDVDKAILNKAFVDGFDHYVKYGFKEGRKYKSATDNSPYAINGQIIVDEANYWVGRIPYYMDSVVSTQKLNKSNPPRYMDCSDFTSSVYLTVANVNIGTSTGTQKYGGQAIDISAAKSGNYSALVPGDLIIFTWPGGSYSNGDHVAIYMGNGMIVHESGTNSTSGNVKTAYLNTNWGSPYGVIRDNIIAIRRVL